MLIDDLHTNDAVLIELGRRLERHRLERNWTQTEMAEAAGLGRATLQRLERGRSVQSLSIVKVLRTLGLLGALEVALPERVELPIAELERQRPSPRRRARGRSAGSSTQPRERPWRWGEEGGGPR